MITRDGVTYPETREELIATGRWEAHLQDDAWVVSCVPGYSVGYPLDEAIAIERDRALVAKVAEQAAEIERLRAQVPTRERVSEALAMVWTGGDAVPEDARDHLLEQRREYVRIAIDGHPGLARTMDDIRAAARLLGLDVRDPHDPVTAPPATDCKTCLAFYGADYQGACMCNVDTTPTADGATP